jgi:CTP-dependent riboflavin kinase
MSRSFILSVCHEQHEDCSGLHQPPREMRCHSEFEVLEYIREHYFMHRKWLEEMTDEELLTRLYSVEGLVVTVTVLMWDVLRLRGEG